MTEPPKTSFDSTHCGECPNSRTEIRRSKHTQQSEKSRCIACPGNPTDAVACPAPAELSGSVMQACEDALAATRAALDRLAFAQQVEAGRSMGREKAIAYALTGDPSGPGNPRR